MYTYIDKYICIYIYIICMCIYICICIYIICMYVIIAFTRNQLYHLGVCTCKSYSHATEFII